ncbi:uncharacterized protein LOC132087800 isoform X2 [Daphnia carinata]|uniref:uncharacterized protein LOC132087800 isoform X2 n=1 Tax=Daphnia carinata TaxID=120202 RepID=UPI0028693FC3|nr:uncharacterized protein LOC132087800 isoform X2 [Daphnia carinata]
MIHSFRLWRLAIVLLGIVLSLMSSSVEGSVIRHKREPQRFLGVIIESALTGQHHGFGHRPPYYGYGNVHGDHQRHWWLPSWWPSRKER